MTAKIGRPPAPKAELKPEYGFWRILGDAPPGPKGERMVRVECTGPKCKGARRVEKASSLVNGYTRSCRACARFRTVMTRSRVGGVRMGGIIE